MKPVASVVLRTRLVDAAILDEMRRWGLQIDAPEKEAPPKTPEQIVALLQEALESEGYVAVQETDLAVLQQYAATAEQGHLHLVLDEDDRLEEAMLPVTFGRTPLNEYILPWRSETIADVLANGMTYLLDGEKHVYFKEVRELFFGDTKAFMICRASFIERSEEPSTSEAQEHHEPS